MSYERFLPEAKTALALSDRELLIQLGTQLAPRGFNPPDPGELVTLAKEWVRNNLGRLRGIVCQNSHIQASLAAPKATLVAVVADYLTNSQLAIDLPCVTIAALIVSIGIGKICHNA